MPENPPPAPGGTPNVQSLMQKCASLELRLQTESARVAELDATIKRMQAERRQSETDLAAARQQIEELQQTRTRLTAEIDRTEQQLRRQVVENEQLQGKIDRMQSSRQLVGDRATEQTETINALRAENEQLRARVEAALNERDRHTEVARAETALAQSRTAEAAFAQLWTELSQQLPEIFLPTHVPTPETFARAGEALVDFIRLFATLELHVHEMLKQLRQVGEQDDKLNRFYIVFSKSPGLVEALSDFLARSKRKGNFANLLRAVQIWSRAFGTGLYKVVVKSPVAIAAELNYRHWPMARGRFETEEAAIGKHFRDVAFKEAPEKLGTAFRKQAADEAYEDYTALMRQQAADPRP